jgi:Cdc6-like AAA superfamily ATPase
MASPKSKESKTSAGTSANASVEASGKIFVGKSDKPEYLTLKLANRHGLVTGATGTGKTVTLQVIAEGLARAVCRPARWS